MYNDYGCAFLLSLYKHYYYKYFYEGNLKL